MTRYVVKPMERGMLNAKPRDRYNVIDTETGNVADGWLTRGDADATAKLLNHRNRNG